MAKAEDKAVNPAMKDSEPVIRCENTSANASYFTYEGKIRPGEKGDVPQSLYEATGRGLSWLQPVVEGGTE